MERILALGLAACLTAVPAQADQIELTAPMQGASLHDGGVDMAIYFVEADDLYEVVATYIDATGPYDPARLRMGLADGDAVHFSLPGLRHVGYAFERDGGTVRVTAEPRMQTISQAGN
jgi:hypothetical protein